MNLYEILQPSRLTEVVDIGANPIDGAPPYKPMLDAGLCRVTGFEPQESALGKLLRSKGANERYLPYAVGDGEVHIRSPGEPVVTITADAINDLRNAMRKELGFGKGIQLPAEKAWIASLQRVAIPAQPPEMNVV